MPKSRGNASPAINKSCGECVTRKSPPSSTTPNTQARREKAWATRPPTVTLAAGVHQGPVLLDREQHLVGEPGAVVRGGILVTADGRVTRKGVLTPDEAMPFQPYVDELARRGVMIREL